jgi:hypothetical protein
MRNFLNFKKFLKKSNLSKIEFLKNEQNFLKNTSHQKKFLKMSLKMISILRNFKICRHFVLLKNINISILLIVNSKLKFAHFKTHFKTHFKNFFFEKKVCFKKFF